MRYAFDTNVWRYAFTDEAFANKLDALGLSPVGLPAVVAFELLKTAATERAVERAQGTIKRFSHATVAPSADDWLVAATALRLVRRRFQYDQEGLRRLQNDALIATTCVRVGWTLVTANQTDFERLATAAKTTAPRTIFLDIPEIHTRAHRPGEGHR